MLADQRPAQPALSEQERQALLLWFQGMSKASVGRRMSISENTVRQYISRARAKYAATGRTAPSKDALLARAIEDGVIKPGEITPLRVIRPRRGWPSSPGAPAPTGWGAQSSPPELHQANRPQVGLGCRPGTAAPSTWAGAQSAFPIEAALRDARSR